MDLLHAVFNHLVLPPRVPGEQDPNIEAVSQDVLARFICACEALVPLVGPPWSEVFQSLRLSLEACRALNLGNLEKSMIQQHFGQLEPNHMLILHVVEQNAALLVRCEDREDGQYVIFEAFETCATSEQVLAAGHTLQWDFPGRSAQIRLDDLADGPFQESLAAFLEQASVESLYTLQATARKANVSVTETRDTTDPGLITQMLMPLLEALGSRFQTPVLRKRIRDEVNIKNADLPWRRLPFWLVLRVAAQRQLCLRLGNEQGRIGYKFLMCLLLARLLKDSAGNLSPELVINLRAKLCRRMAKLEKDRADIRHTEACVYEPLFERISPIVEAIVEDANAKVRNAWENFKEKTMRHVPRLLRYAPDHTLHLSLPNSGAYLDNVLNSQPTQQVDYVSVELPQPLDKAISQCQEFTDKVFGLAAMETRATDEKWPSMSVLCSHETRCLELATQIDQVFEEVDSMYKSDPEQMSNLILVLFNLWVRLDECAIKAAPILQDHRPVFSPELLDVLQLPTVSGMCRLYDIQKYLDQRRSGSRYGTILDKTDKSCLAVRYVASSTAMQSLGIRIQNASDLSRDAKELEWKSTRDEYDELTQKILEDTCRCSWVNGERDIRGCLRCFHYRTRNRLIIQVHEAFLPENDPARSSVIFELGIPAYLSAYRNTTWKILRLLAYPSCRVGPTKPEVLLGNCQPLRQYMTANTQGISLGSTIKCFSQTHYKFNQGMVPLYRVLLPLAANFRLYDNASGLWVEDLQKPLTFEHLCGVHIPRALQGKILSLQEHPPINTDGPSSYEVQANQSECPPDMSLHEFSAYQKLLAGKVRRWPNILVEMNSPNLNFSSEDTMRVVSQLAIQAGPWLPDEVLRTAHIIFKEPAFLERLIEVIETRFHSIRTNWREHNCMELIITLSLRLFSLSSDTWKLRAGLLLKAMRDATLDWTMHLRNEVNNAVEADAAQRATRYGFLAALLCRRTLATYVESRQVMSAEDLTIWIQASVALQENLMTDFAKLPQELRSMLIRDTKMAYYIRPILENAVVSHPASVNTGIGRSWSNSTDDGSSMFSVWKFLPRPHDRWIVAEISWSWQGMKYKQIVHCNFIEGHLLVNGRPRGKLPLEIRDNPMVKQLFGNRHLLTYPSSLPGMSHQLVGPMEHQEIHFGMRNAEVIIRSWTGRDMLEYVPKDIFDGPNYFDLPAELVDKCAHWLNLSSKCLEIRRIPTIWIKRQRDWEIDIPGRTASRGKVRLVDPQSAVFSQVAGVLQHFEEPRKLTVYQPQKGPLAVELRDLGLSFAVNWKNLLECRQLRAEIDPDQDAGTWYGLDSKIVLRDTVSSERSVIVPLGKVLYQRRGIHVGVRMDTSSVIQTYGRYKINQVLGHLSCPPEPLLIYTKALCHATTSFCLQDTLTGRTGTEEAFTILRSGLAQPWTPLGGSTQPILGQLASLSPQRQYYPPQIKRLQSVSWQESLTTTIQHDGYVALIRDIIQKSGRLDKFAAIDAQHLTLEEPTHLRQRGEICRLLYERPMGAAGQTVPDTVYVTRDRKATSKAANVYEIARLMLTDCAGFHMHGTIMPILESCQIIGGFQSEVDLLPSNAPLISQIEEPIGEQWGQLVDFCRFSDHAAPVLFRLGLLAFHSSHSMDMIRTLAAFFVSDDLRDLQPPLCRNFPDFKSREKPPAQLLEKLIGPACTLFEQKVFRKHEWRDEAGRTAQAHKYLCEEEAWKFANYLAGQWPRPADEISIENINTEIIDISVALDNISPEWERRRHNRELEGYIKQVQAILDSLKGHPQDDFDSIEWTDEDPIFVGKRQLQIVPNWAGELIDKDGPDLEKFAPKDLVGSENAKRWDTKFKDTKNQVPGEIRELEGILNRFGGSAQELRRQYGFDLLQSLTALKSESRKFATEIPAPTVEATLDAIEQMRLSMRVCRQKIFSALDAYDRRSTWLQLGALWPCTAPTSLLEILRSKTPLKFGAGMKEALVRYALGITNLQRLYRIYYALLQDNGRALAEELRNPGHENWQPLEQTDWLLLEIDGDFLIRPEQVDVAWAIIAPKSKQNSVIQMNMGKGKTSCIMPMVAAFLADGKNLVRLIVPKALLRQTAQVMQSRLGGLVGRTVRHMPFSRRTSTTAEMLALYAELHREAYVAKGLILTSHEHVLSYKLGGWQSLADGKFEAAGKMIGFQRWIDKHCRDVLDECDFTLSVKTQLNYPSGRELAVDGHPFRWKVAQDLLALAVSHIPVLREQFPTSIKVLQRPGSFPMVQFLKTDVENALHDLLLDDVCAGRSIFLRPAKVESPNWQENIRRVLLDKKPDDVSLKQAAKGLVSPKMAFKILLVVRGLLRDRILFLCLNKRWNVQYGLHPDRHPVAVPFEAKGVPSELSEFGHPDVTILFTCLAFYYGGLTCQQFTQGLQQILHSDDPAAQYELWISGCNGLPDTLRHWNVIHVDDTAQVEKLWQYLRLDSTVVNHYLNHFVFPVHAKQFEVKLQTSSWDIPHYTKAAQQSARTTGFSGTNDNRTMLPLTIRQDDLPSLRQTGAEVLSYLLQSRNRGYEVTSDLQGKRLTEAGLLRKLERAKIRILIDAGAYILEMDNRTLAKTWLSIDKEPKAAVYFGNDNRAWVHYRGDTKGDVPLLATPFADDLSECVVYLDEAHTRGIDLKLPEDAHGALTLALKQTKDYTMQAAMRLRQLQTTQRVTFFAPPEVDQSIRDFCRPGIYERLESPHVISWLLEQTCRTNEDLQGLYIAQGIDFCRRTDAEWRYDDFLKDVGHRTQILKTLRQPEHQTLEQLYGESSTVSLAGPIDRIFAPQLRTFATQLSRSVGRRDRYQTGALEEVEQEREVQQQVEQVRQVQKPPRYNALKFPGLHPSIESFARTGVLENTAADGGHATFEHALDYMAKTRIGKNYGVHSTGSRLFISKEFEKTVDLGYEIIDNFLRPVEWVLWSPSTLTALVIIPEEAELLLPMLRGVSDNESPIHLIAYAAPVTRAMMSFNSFRYYTIPALPADYSFPEWFRVEIGIVAGRLYVDSAECSSVMQYLGLASEAADGAASTKFADNPALFLLEWLTLRRKTKDIMHTPMGHICRGRTLRD